MSSYYIGLSLLSNMGRNSASPREILHTEGRRVLSLLDGRPEGELEKIMAKDPSGRPFFTDRQHLADFSISHSGNMVAVSFVNRGQTQGNNLPFVDLRTGCDIELVKPRVNARGIAEEFFTEPEVGYIFAHSEGPDSENSCSIERFFQIWTLKECFLKLRGYSVFDMAKAPSFIGADGGLHLEFPGPLKFHFFSLSSSAERYVLASAVEGPLQASIRWFSPPLALRNMAAIKAETSPDDTVMAKM